MKYTPLTAAGRNRRAELQATIVRLAELDVFPGADGADLKAIAQHGTVVTVPEGWSMMVEQTPADKAYVVLRGSASAYVDHQEIASIDAGGIIGEMALLQRRLRSATVVATSELEVLHLTTEAVEELCAGIPAFRDQIERTLGERVARDALAGRG